MLWMNCIICIDVYRLLEARCVYKQKRYTIYHRRWHGVYANMVMWLKDICCPRENPMEMEWRRRAEGGRVEEKTRSSFERFAHAMADDDDDK